MATVYKPNGQLKSTREEFRDITRQAKQEYNARKNAAADRYDSVVYAAPVEVRHAAESGWERIKERAENMYDEAKDFFDRNI